MGERKRFPEGWHPTNLRWLPRRGADGRWPLVVLLMPLSLGRLAASSSLRTMPLLASTGAYGDNAKALESLLPKATVSHRPVGLRPHVPGRQLRAP